METWRWNSGPAQCSPLTRPTTTGGWETARSSGIEGRPARATPASCPIDAPRLQRLPPRRTLVIVLAGGAGGRLELLTRSRAKPAVPFGGHYRLIDFPLSNCLH